MHRRHEFPDLGQRVHVRVCAAGWSDPMTSLNGRLLFCGSVWNSRGEARVWPRLRSATWREPKLTPTFETPLCRKRWRCSFRCMERSREEETKGEEWEEVSEEVGKKKSLIALLDGNG